MKRKEVEEHGITCSCPRCAGLRRYPQPSMCDWCKTVHAGDANNCPVPETHSGQPVTDDRNRHVEWAIDNDPVYGVGFARLVSLVERELKQIRGLVKQEAKKVGLKEMLDARSNGQAGNLLKGSDVPARVKSIKIVVDQIRPAPDGFTAPAIIDFKAEVYGANAWAVNKTNLKAIMKHFGDDEKKLRGKKITLDVISVRNPQSGDVVPSLAVSPRQ
jgi:hypothetical protein